MANGTQQATQSKAHQLIQAGKVGSVANAETMLEKRKGRLNEMLPASIDRTRFLRLAVECVRRTPKLRLCTADSFIYAVTTAAKYGLEIDGLLGSGYIVPYGDEAQFLPGYKGYLQLCRRSGEIARISHGVVYEADEFDFALGDEPFCKHKPLAESDDQLRDENIRFIYVVVKLNNGEKHINVWPVAKIRRHMQKFSKSWRWAENGDSSKGGGRKDSTWHQHFGKMGVKTVMIDTLCSGEVPISLEIQELATLDRNIDMGIGLEKAEPEAPKALTQSLDDLADVLEGSVVTKGSPVDERVPSGAAKPAQQASGPVASQQDPVSDVDDDDSWLREEIPFA